MVSVSVATIPELFERQVAVAPDAVALIADSSSLTYRELSERADRLARVLAGHGIGPESIVGVALRRSPELWVAVLAVMKAGGTYLPLDLAHPDKRITFMVEDSDTCLILADETTAGRLPELPVPVLLLTEAESAAMEGPGGPAAGQERPLRATNTAYVIYTSGSTGQPKGVAVTHAGLASLLATHQDRLKVTPQSRVLQFASPSFDASVWEMCMALLSGAAFVVAGEDGLAPGTPVTDTIARHQVTHVTLPPPVLATVAAGALSTVECLVVAGDATTPELADTWSVGRRMINAYGPTETTVCATMSSPLRGDGSVPPIGQAIEGSQVYVLDDALRPVAPGQIGELYVSGISLARGYLARPGMTSTRFAACPFGEPGERMYRTGDLTAWGEDGELVFHGRADTQVKIRGLRIEPLEIEAVLVTHPGVANAAVIARDGHGTGKRLVAYVVPAASGQRVAHSGYGDIALDSGFHAGELRKYLARRLPDYMIPAAFVVLDHLPLNPNGKLDKDALPDPGLQRGAYRAPRTDWEETLAGVFAEVLGLDRLGVDDDFFAIGGDSIRSIQVVSRARAQGVEISTRQIFEFRTIDRLAAVAAGNTKSPVLQELEGGGTGWMPLLPVARWIKSWGPGFDRFLQAMVLELPQGIDRGGLTATLGAMLDRHDLLRSRLVTDRQVTYPPVTDDGILGGGILVTPPGSVSADPLLRRVACDGRWHEDAWCELVLSELDAAAERLDPAAGVMAQFVWFDPVDGDRGRMLVVLHHLVVDGVSWRILMPDLAAIWRQVRAGRTPEPAPATTSMRRWAHTLVKEAARPERMAEFDLWWSIVDRPDPVLGARRLDPAVDVISTVEGTTVQLTAAVTEALLTTLPAAFHGEVNDGLLAALALALGTWRDGHGVAEHSSLVRLEGHGREEAVAPGADLSGTVGWFTSVFPVRLDLTGVDLAEAFAGGPAAGHAIRTVKEQLRAIPDKGIGYGLLRHLNPETGAVLEQYDIGQVGFNYLGRFSAATDMPEALRDLGFTQVTDVAELAELDAAQDPRMPAPAELDINASVTDTSEGPVLTAVFKAPTGVLSPTEVSELAELWCAALEGLAQHAAQPGVGGLTPSDVRLVSVGQGELEEWQRRYPGLADVWPSTPLQSGLLFHSMLNDSAFDPYQVQYALHLSGPVDPDRMRVAAQALLDRHATLRTAFVPDATGDLVRLVVDGVELPWQRLDLSGLDEAGRATEFERFLADDLGVHFTAAAPPMMRLALVTMSPERHELVLTAHHVLFDGWSVPLLVQDLLRLYGSGGDASALPAARGYQDFLEWLSRQDRDESARVWSRELAGVGDPTMLAPPANAGTHERTGQGTDMVARGAASIGQADVPLGERTACGLSGCAADLGITLNTLVQGAWAMLLGQLTGRQDVVFASTVAGRPPAVAGVDSMVGMFLNTLPVRVRWSAGETLADVLARLQDRQAALMDHHHFGLTEIYQTAGLDAMFDTIIGFESFPMDRDGIVEASAEAGFSITGIRSFTASHYPVTVLAFVESDRLRLTVQYLTDALDPATADGVAVRFGKILDQLMADPRRRASTIDVLDTAEHELAAAGFTESPVSRSGQPRSVAALVQRRAAATPDAVAVVAGQVSLTYRELEERANRLAQVLSVRGVRQEVVVALALPDPLDLVVGMLGVLKAGAAFLPIDMTEPGPWVHAILADAQPGMTLQQLPDTGDTPPTPAVPPVRAGQLAYVSSTAGPQGVGVTHRSLVNGLVRLAAEIGVGERVLVGAAENFEASLLSALATLVAGGTACLAGTSLGELGAWTGDVITAVPSVAAETLGRPGCALRAESVVFTGEPPAAPLVDRVREAIPDAAVVSVYGPAESRCASAGVLAYGRPRGGAPIGAPVPYARVYVLGPGLTPVPPGAVGELYVAGSPVARGYQGHPAHTAERFVADPFGASGSRMFRTGDRVRWAGGSRLEYVGRTDDLVTIHGHRFAPAQVEDVLADHPAVSQAVVAAWEPHRRASAGTRHLVGYVVTAGASRVSVEDLHDFAAARLPKALVPTAFVLLDRLPSTPDGGVDRAALPRPGSAGRRYRPPRTALEETMCAVVAEVLGAELVGLDDSFFDLGGNSLLATRLTSRIGTVLGVSLSIRAVFQSRDIADLARIAQHATTPSRPRLRKMSRSGQ